MNEWLRHTLGNAGTWLLPMVALASFIEYVVPPFPGDLVTVIGTYLALDDGIPLIRVYAALSAGSLLGPAVGYGIGFWLNAHADRLTHSRIRRWISPERIGKTEALYRRWGAWFILGNRFVLVARSLVFVFAGFSRMSFWWTMLLGVPSALLWNGLIVGATYELGMNSRAVLKILKRVNMITALLGVAVLALVILLTHRRRKRRRRT